MEQSLFIEWVNKYLPGVTVAIVEKLNDTKNPLTYLHRRMLKKNFSVGGEWKAITANNTLVMADVVAMDSELPLKKRDTISKASGDIPKMGMELKLTEKQLTELDVLVKTQASESQILAKLFADSPRVIGGIYERNERIFLEALSTGMALVEDSENVGTGIRVNFGIPTANKFGVAVLWASASTAKPFDDLQKILDKAALDGHSITKFILDRFAFNNLAKATQTKELFAFYSGFVGSSIPVPSLTQINQYSQDRYGFSFEIVDRSVRKEKNGVQTPFKPWAEGAIAGLTSDIVGTLEWAELAEKNHPAPGVTYITVDDFILVSKYRRNSPLSEYTSGQARVLPVLNNVDQIYLLDSKTVQA
jgi:hypothetical protein